MPLSSPAPTSSDGDPELLEPLPDDEDPEPPPDEDDPELLEPLPDDEDPELLASPPDDDPASVAPDPPLPFELELEHATTTSVPRRTTKGRDAMENLRVRPTVPHSGP
jgi:hypothetical protein